MSDDYRVSLWSRCLVIKARCGHVACSVNKCGAFGFVQLLLIPKPGGSGLISRWEGKVEKSSPGPAEGLWCRRGLAHPVVHCTSVTACCSQSEKRAANNHYCFCNLIFSKQKGKNQGIYGLAHVLTENRGTSAHTDQEQLCRFLHNN